VLDVSDGDFDVIGYHGSRFKVQGSKLEEKDDSLKPSVSVFRCFIKE
jgi:hypothetical protein